MCVNETNESLSVKISEVIIHKTPLKIFLKTMKNDSYFGHSWKSIATIKFEDMGRMFKKMDAWFLCVDWLERDYDQGRRMRILM